MDKIDNRRFWLGAVLATMGVVIMIIGMFIPPEGHISTSVLSGTGEIFLLAGAILGLDQYVNLKVTRILRGEEEKKKNE
jgi:membrane-bound ClpP family serine protease